MLKRDPNDDTDPNAPTTFFEMARANITLDEPGGRFGAQPKVIGTTPTAAELYPAASVPNADVGPEEPLGVAVEAVEPCGTAPEIAASIARLERDNEPG